MPANIINPTTFCEKVKEFAAGDAAIEITVFEEDEIKKMGMNGLIVVGQGSKEKVKLLQVKYKGRSDDKIDIGYVGKGVTFDSGGISIKPAGGMWEMKADMSGGATTVMATLAASKRKLPVNIVCVVPLVENMPSGSATRPGDIYIAMNGKSVEVDNTDAEGRLILADALYYTSKTFNPTVLVDVATLTGAIGVALGDNYYGCFTNSDNLWRLLDDTGRKTGQLAWRMPFEHPRYLELMKSDVADIINANSSRKGGASTAAAFLSIFTNKHPRWAHLDIAGIMMSSANVGYLTKGMTGAPTRTLIELASLVAKEEFPQHAAEKEDASEEDYTKDD